MRNSRDLGGVRVCNIPTYYICVYNIHITHMLLEWENKKLKINVLE